MTSMCKTSSVQWTFYQPRSTRITRFPENAVSHSDWQYQTIVSLARFQPLSEWMKDWQFRHDRVFESLLVAPRWPEPFLFHNDIHRQPRGGKMTTSVNRQLYTVAYAASISFLFIYAYVFVHTFIFAVVFTLCMFITVIQLLSFCILLMLICIHY